MGRKRGCRSAGRTRSTAPRRAALAALLALSTALSSRAQFVRNSALFSQELERQEAALLEQLKSHPDLEDKYFPNKYSIPIDFYRYAPPTGYTQNVIFDPCRGFEFNCCNDTFGAPEFRELVTDPTSDRFGEEIIYKDTGEELSVDASRLPDSEYVLDDRCTGFLEPDTDCIANRVAKRAFPQLPRCWNHNTSVVANQDCRAPLDGSPVPLCLEVGITQTGYIVECGGEFKDDPHCGTYLEIHRPGSTGILSEVKLRGQYTSGYRMTIISLTYKGNSSLVLCEGQHELWWVQRTRYDWVVERRLPFYIVSPQCDWNDVENRYRDYATLDTATPLTGIEIFSKDRFLYSRVRTESRLGQKPSRGMGSTLHRPSGDEFPTSSRFIYGDDFTYSYTPVRPELSVREGELWPTHPSNL